METDVTVQTGDAPMHALSKAEAAYYSATQFQLMWWRFKRHRLAVLGSIILFLYLMVIVAAEFIAPVPVEFRDSRYVLGPPEKIHLFDNEDGLHLRPFVYGVKTTRDPETLGMVFERDLTTKIPVRFFARGESYKLWGLLDAGTHLFVKEDGSAPIHLLGTDQLGRDVFSRIMYATRVSLSIGVFGVFVSFVLGLLIGGLSGYFGGWVDTITQRVIEFIRSIPTLPIWMALAAALPRDWSAKRIYIAVTVILAFLGWTYLGRRVRSKLLSLRKTDFVTAAKIAGSTDARIIGRHLLPSFMSYIIVDLTVAFPTMILGETSLSFVGLGLRPPVVSWGVLLQAGQSVQAIAKYPWLLSPVVFVIMAVLAFSFVGDGARDAADPYSK